MDFNTYEKSGRFAYAALAQGVAAILVAAIKQRGELRVQQIQQRAKDPLSLRRKLEDAEALEAPEVEAFAKDLAGARGPLHKL